MAVACRTAVADSLIHGAVIKSCYLVIERLIDNRLEDSSAIEIEGEIKQASWFEQIKKDRQRNLQVHQIKKGMGDEQIPGALLPALVRQNQRDQSLPVPRRKKGGVRCRRRWASLILADFSVDGCIGHVISKSLAFKQTLDHRTDAGANFQVQI